MRIVSGEWGGRTLLAPRGDAVRPTQDRVRQILFDILGRRVIGAAVLDLYAGTGALGLEALSRGATSVVFVESSARARAALEANRQALGAGARTRLLAMSVAGALTKLESEGRRFDWILADPPYDLGEDIRLIERLGREGDLLIAPDGGVVIETRRESALTEAVGRLERVRVRPAGGTMLHFFERRALEVAR